MAFTDEDKRASAVELARVMFQGGTVSITTLPAKTANLDLDDLKAAVGAIDTAMDTLPAGLNQAQTLKVNLVQSLPEPFKSNSTAQEKALALVAWALRESNLI